MRSACPLVLSLALGFATSSCAGTSQTSSEPSTSRRDVLTQEELVASQEVTALDAVRRLRPRWLRTRGAVSALGPDAIVVFVNDVRVGGIEYLGTLRIEGIQQIRFVRPSDATTRYGTGVAGGVIEVTTKTGGG